MPRSHLRQRCRQRPTYRPPPLSVFQILAWLDAFRVQQGRYPHCRGDGAVPGTATETWFNLDQALRLSLRGLPGGSSLARLLAQQRGVRNARALPPLTIPQLLRWADAHYRCHGRWPQVGSGLIPEAPGETWSAVHAALSQGSRGLPGGSTLPRLLAEYRGSRNLAALPRLTERLILRWADEQVCRTGRWPQQTSGAVAAAPGETWAALNYALTQGRRGLPGGTTLADLLARKRGVRNHHGLARLRIATILDWLDAHQRRTGRWPGRDAGPLPEAPGETWCGIDQALKKGHRGLPGGSSLARLLAARRGVPHRLASQRAAPQ